MKRCIDCKYFEQISSNPGRCFHAKSRTKSVISPRYDHYEWATHMRASLSFSIEKERLCGLDAKFFELRDIRFKKFKSKLKKIWGSITK